MCKNSRRGQNTIGKILWFLYIVCLVLHPSNIIIVVILGKDWFFNEESSYTSEADQL